MLGKNSMKIHKYQLEYDKNDPERKRNICQLVVILATRECGSVEMASLDLSPLQTNLKRSPKREKMFRGKNLFYMSDKS